MDSQAPAGGNQDRGPQTIAIFWAEAGFALIVVALRIWGRVMIHQLGSDDYVMLFTLILFLILSSFVTYYASIGGLRHLYYLQPEQQALVIKYNWITQPWCIFGFATGKISVALLILRLIGPNTFWRKWILYASMVTVFIFNALACIFTFVQCNPPRALWTPQLVATGQAKCWDSTSQADFSIFSAGWNVMIDAVLATLPFTVFYNLSISRKKKLGLSALLGLGYIAAICGIIKIKFLAELNARSDLTWDTYDLFVWSGAELFVIMVCGSIPPIKPLYDTLFGKKRTGYSKQYTDQRYTMEKSLKRPLGSRDMNHSTSSTDERELVSPARGITRVTDVRIIHAQV